MTRLQIGYRLYFNWLAVVLHPHFYLSNLLIVREPLEKLDESYKGIDTFESILYVLASSFIAEGMCSKLTSMFV